jgi:hypothetical protein
MSKNKKVNPGKNKHTSVNCFSIAEECYKDDAKKLEYHKKQREEQGFDDTETWHLDKTFALFMIPRLKRFLEVNNGFPTGETEESYNDKINYIIKSFEDYYFNEYEHTSLDDEKAKIENAKSAVKFLQDLWFDLWW